MVNTRRTRGAAPAGLGVQRAPLKKQRPPPVGPYQVVVYEGPAVDQFKQKHKPDVVFGRLCNKRGDGGIESSYVKGLVNKAPRHSSFLVALQGPNGGVAALAQCTLHGHMRGFKASRLVFVDLVCSDPRSKGSGTILMREMELYARRLGASVAALQSVSRPGTMQGYNRKGYVRGVGARTSANIRLARMHFENLKANPGGNLGRLLRCVGDDCRELMQEQLAKRDNNSKISDEFLQALRGEFYPPYNSLIGEGNTVVMYKALSGPTDWSGAVDWQGEHATFVAPRVRELATYQRDPTSQKLAKPGQPQNRNRGVKARLLAMLRRGGII